MNNPESRAHEGDQLRPLAEEAVNAKEDALVGAIDAQTAEDSCVMSSELSVQQIELAMQNEELRRMQKELACERARYFDLYDLAPVGYCTLSANGLILEANLTAATLLGVARGTMINQPFARYIDGNYQDFFYLQMLHQNIGAPQVCELQMAKQDGTLFWAHVAATGVQTASGAFECRLVISDMTDRKRVEDDLHEREAQYRRIVDTAQEGIWVFDQDWRTTYVNSKMAALLGYGPEEMAGKTFADFISADDADDCARRRREREKGGNDVFERRLRHKDGHDIWALVSATAQLGLQGQFLGSFAMLTDITARKRTEEALKQSEQRAKETKNLLQLVLDTIPIRLFWKDLTLTYLGCNTLFAQDAGWNVPEELIGLNDYDMGWRAQADRYRQDDLEVIVSGKAKLQYEELQTTPDGKQIWLSTSKAPLRDGNGAVIGILGAYEDVTQRKLIEEELLRAEKIESLGLFAGGIAHDFNNILMAVMGNIAFAKMFLAPTDKAYERLTIAETSALKARELARQFLTFAKGGAPVKHSVSVDNLITAYGRLTLQGTRSTCEYAMADDLWKIEADEGQIGQALANILLNADQATHEGGVVKVACENVVVSEDDDLGLAPGRYVKISIKDQGNGISQAHRGKVFDPYFTTKGKGSGLGLTSAYSIVKKHGGRLTVESTEGAGSTFTMFLPASLAPVAVSESEEAGLHCGSGKILVMDDDEILLDVIGAMLEGMGYEAEFAQDGKQALEKYALAQQDGAPFDAVIMDLIIPAGMGGREAMEQLRAIDPQARVIVSSGYSNNSVMADYESYGFSDVIAKPYRFSDLSKKLQQVLRN